MLIRHFIIALFFYRIFKRVGIYRDTAQDITTHLKVMFPSNTIPLYCIYIWYCVVILYPLRDATYWSIGWRSWLVDQHFVWCFKPIQTTELWDFTGKSCCLFCRQLGERWKTLTRMEVNLGLVSTWALPVWDPRLHLNCWFVSFINDWCCARWQLVLIGKNNWANQSSAPLTMATSRSFNDRARRRCEMNWHWNGNQRVDCRVTAVNSECMACNYHGNMWKREELGKKMCSFLCSSLIYDNIFTEYDEKIY